MDERLGEVIKNSQGCYMKIIEYKNSHDIIIEFQDDYKFKKHTKYSDFKKGSIKNPYHPIICGVGMIGANRPLIKKGKYTKEYQAWTSMLYRCYDEKFKKRYPTYENAYCCDEWLLYENFYEWLHSQENFDKWLNGKRWAVDKDILFKRNKIYSPNTCCLVPDNINCLFTKHDSDRGDYPIGVCKKDDKFMASCKDPFSNKRKYLGLYDTHIKAFLEYKKFKENLIKKMANSEYEIGNITKECYESMMRYIVEIDD